MPIYQKLVLSLISLVLLLLVPSPSSIIQAQGQDCKTDSDLTQVRATDLILSTNGITGKFDNPTGICVVDKKAFTNIPSYTTLKTTFYDQYKGTTPPKQTESPTLTWLGGDSLYSIAGSLTVSQMNLSSTSGTKIIFVRDYLYIDQDISYGTNNTGLVFIVGGNIYIKPTVQTVNAILISQGTIYTAVSFNPANPINDPSNLCSTSSVNTGSTTLTVKGSLISLKDTAPIQFCRKLNNNDVAAEKVVHQPKYLVILKDLLGQIISITTEDTGFALNVNSPYVAPSAPVAFTPTCSAFPSPTYVNLPVTWTANVTPAGTYTYAWSGNGITGTPTSQTVSGISYSTAGTKTVSVRVTDINNVSLDTSCSLQVANLPSSANNVTTAINTSADDVTEDYNVNTNGSLNYSDNQSQIWFGTGEDTNRSYTGLRFNSLNIPQGSTITSAHLEFYFPSTNWITDTTTIRAEDVGNSQPFSLNARPSQRALTSTYATHNDGSQNQIGWYPFDEMKSVVQSVVNRSDWAPGNSLSIILKGSSGSQWARKFFSSKDDTNNNPPKLVISYQNPQLSNIRRVFVTDNSYSGNLPAAANALTPAPNPLFTTDAGQGILAADYICQNRANSSNLGGTWKAWLSDNTDASSPSNRFTSLLSFTGTFIKLNGVAFANGWSGLTTAVLSPLNVNNNQGAATGTVFSNTRTDGTRSSLNTCTNWTTSSSTITSHLGSATLSTSAWTTLGSNRSCPGQKLYCFEQGQSSSSLISYWTLDETGSTFYDTKGVNNGTDNSSALAAGKIANARSFSNGQRVSVPANSSLNMTGNDFSVSFWLKPTDTNNTWRTIFVKGSGNTDQRNYAMWFWPTSNKLHFRVDPVISGNDQGVYQSIKSLSVGTWYFVAGTYSASTQTLSLYIYDSSNGTGGLDSQQTGVVMNSSSINSNPLNIGSATDWLDAGAVVDEFGLWNKTLSPQEISSLYNNGQGARP